MIDLKHAENTFDQYVQQYDPSIGKIRLKIVHTYYVAQLSYKIAQSLNLNEEDTELAWLIGLLHDIGRFEQYRRYGDYRDFLNEDHAKLGVEVLRENEKIRSFIEDDQYDEIIYKAILYHNRYALPSDLNEREMLFSRIIRDADKIDIFRVKIEDPLEDIIPFTKQQMEDSPVSEEIIRDFYKEQCIHVGLRKTPADTWITTMAFIYDFNFASALKILQEKEYTEKMMHRFHFNNAQTEKAMEDILMYADAYINRRIQEEK